jgi:FixJ family two-component response regulator
MAKPWIAIVDDDPSMLVAFARLLRVRALQARTYNSAREFLASLGDGLPECLIVDYQMPEMTGLELRDHLLRTGIQIPTIVITGNPDVTIRKRCEVMGVIACLPKPLQTASLYSAIYDARKIAADEIPRSL